MGETSTVGLNLAGNFSEQAEVAAAAAQKLGAAVGVASEAGKQWTAADSLKVMEASAKSSYDAMVAGAKKAKAAQEALVKSLRDASKASREKAGPDGGWQNKLPSSLAQAPPVFSGFQKMLGAVNNALGPKAAEGLVKGAQLLEQAAPSLKMAGSVVSVAGGAIAAGALALTAAGYAAVKLGSAVIEMGVESTSRRQAQESILRKLGGSYELPIQLAARFGLDQGEAVTKVKQLLSAKFDSAEIKQLIKINVGISAVLGPEKAKAFLDKMAMMVKKGSKATEEAISGMAEAGVDVDKAWKILAAKLGVSVAIAKGKVKSGAVEMKVALDAVKQAAEQDFGGIANAMGNSVPAKLLHLKTLFSGLFDQMDLGPIKGFLDNLIGALSGGAGAALKSSLQELFGAISHTLLDPFKGDSGKAKMENMIRGIASVIRDAAGAVKAAAPAFLWIVDAISDVAAAARANTPAWQAFSTALDVVAAPARALFALFGGFYDYVIKPVIDAINLLTGQAPAAGAAGNSIGSMLGSGVVEGITGAIAFVVQAAGAMGDAAAGALKAALGVASPAKVGIFVGDMLGKGVAQGASNDNGVTAAGAGIADRATAGLASGAAGAMGAGGGAGGGASVIINITLPPGSPAETQAAAKAGAEAAFLAWQQHKRRDARERAA